MSNVNAGEMAVMIRPGASDPCLKHMIGTVIKVTIPVFLVEGLWWQYEGPEKPCRKCNLCAWAALPDAGLKRIDGDNDDSHPGDVLVKHREDATNPFVVIPPEKQLDRSGAQ